MISENRVLSQTQARWIECWWTCKLVIIAFFYFNRSKYRIFFGRRRRWADSTKTVIFLATSDSLANVKYLAFKFSKNTDSREEHKVKRFQTAAFDLKKRLYFLQSVKKICCFLQARKISKDLFRAAKQRWRSKDFLSVSQANPWTKASQELLVKGHILNRCCPVL